MIKLKIKRLRDDTLSETIINFDGVITPNLNGKFVTENIPGQQITHITYCPILQFHGWEVIEQII